MPGGQDGCGAVGYPGGVDVDGVEPHLAGEPLSRGRSGDRVEHGHDEGPPAGYRVGAELLDRPGEDEAAVGCDAGHVVLPAEQLAVGRLKEGEHDLVGVLAQGEVDAEVVQARGYVEAVERGLRR